MRNGEALEVLRGLRDERRRRRIVPDTVPMSEARDRGVDDDNIIALGRTGHVTKVRTINEDALVVR